MTDEIERLQAHLREDRAVRDYRKRDELPERVKRRVIGWLSQVAAIHAVATALWVLSFFKPMLRPIWSALRPIVWSPLKWGWGKFARAPSGDLSKGRSVAVVACYGLWLILVWQALFLALDVAVYAATVRRAEVIYLSNSHEIDPDGNVYSVYGCDAGEEGAKGFVCDDQHGLSFRIAPSLFNTLWSLAHRGTFFYPDYVVAPVAPGWEKCLVDSYWFRQKTLGRRWDIWPMILSVKCGAVE